MAVRDLGGAVERGPATAPARQAADLRVDDRDGLAYLYQESFFRDAFESGDTGAWSDAVP